MSDDTNLFQPPPSYPEAPKNMYYEIPTTKPEPQRLAQIFPWESRASKPTRVFATEPTVTSGEPPLDETDDTSQHSVRTFPESVQPQARDLWQSWSRSNAWDEVPEIERYVEAIQRPRKWDGRPATSPGAGSRKASLRITDFPTEIDRPSLPVTPAPVRKSFWGQDAEGTSELPAAEGVPSQEDWVRVTADVFLHLLRSIYSYQAFTESNGSAGRASKASGRALRDTDRAPARATRVVRQD
jgi:glycogenin glucosyltransferase